MSPRNPNFSDERILELAQSMTAEFVHGVDIGQELVKKLIADGFPTDSKMRLDSLVDLAGDHAIDCMHLKSIGNTISHEEFDATRAGAILAASDILQKGVEVAV